MARISDLPILPCEAAKSTQQQIDDYARAILAAAPSIGDHGLSKNAFWESGLFHAAIERLRGQRAASMNAKRSFIADILNWLKAGKQIHAWKSAGQNDRHDYEVYFRDGHVCAIEAKGCLDGNNTNIFQRPPNADEFVIWSLCQNAGADPRHNAWSGVHTRLGAEIMHRRELVDGLIIWDPLCGNLGRPCPKLLKSPGRATSVDPRRVPPPCLYLFPRSVPDARNNPEPPVHTLKELPFLRTLYKAFRCDPEDVTQVQIIAGMVKSDVVRTTKLVRDGVQIVVSRPTKVKRAKA